MKRSDTAIQGGFENAKWQEMGKRQCGEGGLRTAALELIQRAHVT
jgi:hypothetical protein